ncbi:hypothetical protein D9M70_507510 [compost metagenome]
MSKASVKAVKESSRVAGKRSTRISNTSRFKEMEVPKSPMSAASIQTPNCTGKLWSSPYLARSNAISAASEPGAIIMAIGSPGTIRNRMNTINATPKSVTAAEASRLIIETMIIGAAGPSPVPVLFTELKKSIRCRCLRESRSTRA